MQDKQPLILQSHIGLRRPLTQSITRLQCPSQPPKCYIVFRIRYRRFAYLAVRLQDHFMVISSQLGYSEGKMLRDVKSTLRTCLERHVNYALGFRARCAAYQQNSEHQVLHSNGVNSARVRSNARLLERVQPRGCYAEDS